jgi:neuroligin
MSSAVTRFRLLQRSIVCVALIYNVLHFVINGVAGKVVPLQMSPRVVDTQFGKLRGVLLTMPTARGGVATVELFSGIQYASLLGGDLRFMPPTGPMDKWDNVRVAHMMRPVCMQRIPDLEKLEHRMPLSRLNHLKRLSQFVTNQDEDCLYLNIYVPVRGEILLSKAYTLNHCQILSRTIFF